MNEETMQNAIMFRCGMLETFYPDPPTLQKMVNIWFTQNHANFTRLWDAYNLVYNPIGNVDLYTDNSRHVNAGSQQTDSRDRTENVGEDVGETETYTRENTVDSTRDRNQTVNTDTDRTTENTVSAFNTDTYQPDTRQTVQETVDTTLSEDITDNTTQDISDNRNTNKDRSQTTTENEGYTSNKSESEVNVFDEHRRGADGRFSFQEMIQQEIELWGNFSVYEYIADKFEKAFCVLCY